MLRSKIKLAEFPILPGMSKIPAVPAGGVSNSVFTVQYLLCAIVRVNRRGYSYCELVWFVLAGTIKTWQH